WEKQLNDTAKSATRLTPKSGLGIRLNYSYMASIADSTDVDYYRVRAPRTAGGAPQEMIAVVSSFDFHGLAPRVDVFDKNGLPVAARVIGNEPGFFSVQVPGALSDQDYLIRVSAIAPGGPMSAGNYFVGVNFSPHATVTVNAVTAGVLTAQSPGLGQTLTV